MPQKQLESAAKPTLHRRTLVGVVTLFLLLIPAFLNMSYQIFAVYVLVDDVLKTKVGMLTDIHSKLTALSSGVNRRALLVSFRISSPLSVDLIFKERAEYAGYKVDTIKDTMVTGEICQLYDIVMISASVISANIGNRLNDCSTPQLYWEATMYTRNGMATAGGTNRYSTFLNWVSPADYLSGEFADIVITTTGANTPLTMHSDVGTISLLSSPYPMQFAYVDALGPGAEVLATFPDQPDKAAIFKYEKGAKLANGYPSPALRIAWPIFHFQYGINATCEEIGLSTNPLCESESTISQSSGYFKSFTFTTLGVSMLDATIAYMGNKRALLVTSIFGEPLGVDHIFKERAELAGYSVNVAFDLNVTAEMCTPYDIVMISASVMSFHIGTRLNACSAPQLLWETGMYHRNGMTTPFGLPLDGANHFSNFLHWVTPDNYPAGEFTDINVSLAGALSPLLAGASSGQKQLLASAYALQYAEVSALGPGADVLATIPGHPDKAAIFKYEQGATLADGYPSPALRIGWPIFHFEQGMNATCEEIGWPKNPRCKSRYDITPGDPYFSPFKLTGWGIRCLDAAIAYMGA